VFLNSFREWLHSYLGYRTLELSEYLDSSHLFQRVASFLLTIPLFVISIPPFCSHLFQRVASFLHYSMDEFIKQKYSRFSSLSESGFIPTEKIV